MAVIYAACCLCARHRTFTRHQLRLLAHSFTTRSPWWPFICTRAYPFTDLERFHRAFHKSLGARSYLCWHPVTSVVLQDVIMVLVFWNFVLVRVTDMHKYRYVTRTCRITTVNCATCYCAHFCDLHVVIYVRTQHFCYRLCSAWRSSTSMQISPNIAHGRCGRLRYRPSKHAFTEDERTSDHQDSWY